MICTVSECQRPMHGRGMCNAHYKKWRLQNPGKVERHPASETADQRFWRRVQGGDPEACWTWSGSPDKDGYGKFVIRRKWYQAHRYAYEALIGEIPDGLEIDHLCCNRACVNPWHLEPVSHRVNTQRKFPGVRDGRPRQLAAHCSNGHERSEANTYYSPNDGYPICRRCNAESQRRRKARLRVTGVTQ